MKTKSIAIKGTILTTLALGAFGAKAQQFSYNSGLGALGDVLVCFRPTSSGSYDLVVDAGSISTFTSLTRGQSININPSFYAGTLLSYTGTNSISWAAFACQRASGNNNIWITRPRSSSGVQSTPWPCKISGVQANAASQIDAIGTDGVDISYQPSEPFGTSPTSTTTAVVEPEGGNNGAGQYFNSYSYMTSSAGNLSGAFWGDAASKDTEQSTASNFTTSGQPVIADFYELDSANSGSLGTYLGYFSFSPSGVMTYTAGPYITAPVITSITRVGNVTTIQFQSNVGEVYTLKGAADASTPRSSWPTIGTTQTGDGLVDTFTDTTSDASRVYVISGQ